MMHQSFSKDFYCFDCDGVLWRGKEPIHEARDLLIKLKQAKKSIRFITNSSVLTREKFASKIKNVLNLPFDIDPIEIVSAAFVTAGFLNKTIKKNSSVLVIGLEGIKLELERVGFIVTRDFDDKSCESYGAVVVGFDVNFNYNSIAEAIKVFQFHPDAILVACNSDATYIGEEGKILPGTGCLVEAVAYATGRRPITMGKPNNYIYSALLESCPEFDPSRAVFIGDRLDSDIAFANLNGMRSVLVETGVHKRSDVKEIIPNICIKNLSEFHLLQ